MADDTVQVITDTTFEQDVLKSDRPVLVDFWAPWCHPCRLLAPVVEKLAEEYGDSGPKVCKLEVTENPDTPGNYGVQGIPTLILFENGEEQARSVGVKSEDELRSLFFAQDE